MKIISRRDLLTGGVGIAGAAAAAGSLGLLSTPDSASAAAAQAPQAARPAAREAFENLTAVEADILEAFVDRLIPTDANGPGAREARAAHYIDKALGSALASSKPAYVAGLASLDKHARASKGKGFAELAAADQDALLAQVEGNQVPAGVFAGNPSQFFGLVLNHTHQGMFGDPYYGGNANFIGWDLLGYPGVRTMVTPADQKSLEAGTLKPNHRSAYDYESFNKAVASADMDHGDMKHGD